MRLIIVRHAETDWTGSGHCTGATDLVLTTNGRSDATSLSSLLENVLPGQSPVVVSSSRLRAPETVARALPECHLSIDPLVAEYDYGDHEGLTAQQIRLLLPQWDIWRDGCPNG